MHLPETRGGKLRLAALALTALVAAIVFAVASVAGARMGEVMGVLARKGDAQIAANDQVGARKTVVIARVVAPHDSWVFVHNTDGDMPGAMVGAVRVKKGVSENVEVTLDTDKLTPTLLAALHVDHGKPDVAEWDMKRAEQSPDKPYFIDGKELATRFKIAEFGVPVGMDGASIEAGEQSGGATVRIAKVVSPTPAFVLVHEDLNWMPGKRLGFAPVPAGESSDVEVKLDRPVKSGKLLAAVHADRGEAGKLEFDMEDVVNSPDQPFMADGMEVAVAFEVGPFGVPVEKAAVEAADQVGAKGEVTIAKVDAPTGAWVVVHKDAGGGTPGARVGLAYVGAGESTDVKVKLDTDTLSGDLLAAVHADRGTSAQFDFDMMKKLDSPDQPFFVDGKEVASAFKVRDFGVTASAGTALVEARPQQVMDGQLTVDRVVAPAGAWVVVHLDAGGMPGPRVGLAHVKAGETRGLTVQLDASRQMTDKLLVAVHADRGEAGMFEFDMDDKVNSPDQPFFVNGAEVAVAVPMR